MSTHRAAPLGALALAAAGVLFLLYPATRPWHDETTHAGATAAMASGAWVASHLFAMIGFILIPLGLLALYQVLRGGVAQRPAFAALILSWLGIGLTLPYYGAETYGLYAAATHEGVTDLVGVSEAFRLDPVAATTFGVGLVLLAVGAVLAAVAIWRSQVLPRYLGIPFALGFALFLPQFFTPAAVRISHGVLIAVGTWLLAYTLWRPRTRPQS